ncbi:hypothetical protein HanPI659440_Chr05g0189561 [Helianthus annuus]|nr:hypothetical protein HanPI659440_Chr05g0189561 [Helianthus annuus]
MLPFSLVPSHSGQIANGGETFHQTCPKYEIKDSINFEVCYLIQLS